MAVHIQVYELDHVVLPNMSLPQVEDSPLDKTTNSIYPTSPGHSHAIIKI